MSTDNPTAPAPGLKSPEELAREIATFTWLGTFEKEKLTAAIARTIAEDRLNRVGLDVDGCVKDLIQYITTEEIIGHFHTRLYAILHAHLRPDPLVAAVVEAIREYDRVGRVPKRLRYLLPACRALAKGSGR